MVNDKYGNLIFILTINHLQFTVVSYFDLGETGTYLSIEALICK